MACTYTVQPLSGQQLTIYCEKTMNFVSNLRNTGIGKDGQREKEPNKVGKNRTGGSILSGPSVCLENTDSHLLIQVDF